MTIPAQAHFCWIGARLPWAYVFAVLSAAARAGMDEVVLHHTDELESGPERRALEQAAGVRLARCDPEAVLIRVGADLGVADALMALYRGLDNAVKRADVLRAAILYREGGVYLDLDTVTVASLRPLLAPRQFLGHEFIVWTPAVRRSRAPGLWARALTLDLLRKILRRLPGGWRGFRGLERFYFRGVNNAVMGAEPGAPLMRDYLMAMLALPAALRNRPYALGPNLLQKLVVGRDDITVVPPEVFYPLPPEISEHWFRVAGLPALAQVLTDKARVVHWYASVRTRSRVAAITPDYVRQHRDRQLYSALVCSALPELLQS